MDKEDLNRQFGDPERQKPVTPLDLIAAALLIRDYCCNTQDCTKCIFNTPHGCALFEMSPFFWNLSDAKVKVKDWIKEQCPQYGTTYLDTDKYTDE